jgi:hypothetical protein
MAIRFLLSVILLSAHTVYAQKGSLYLRPALGIQSPVSKVLQSNYTKGKLTNNVPNAYIYYALGVEYELQKQQAVYLQYLNGKSGYSVAERSLPCNNGYSGSYRVKYTATAAFNNKRINIGYRRPLFKPLLLGKHNAHIQTFIQAGIALDIKGTESDEGASLILPGPNRCGEIYYLKDTILLRRKASWVLPLQLAFQWYNKKNKNRLQLALFANLGLTNVSHRPSTSFVLRFAGVVLQKTRDGFTI